MDWVIQGLVMKLMEKLLDTGHELYVDNFHTSGPLAKQLLNRKTLLCGTLRSSCKHLPERVVSAKLKKGETISQRDGCIVVTKWKDKRDVIMLSTHHTGKMTAHTRCNRNGEPIMEPDSILTYNMHLCGVDRSDQFTSYYTPLRKTLRWYKKIVLHFLDLAMANAYLLYKKCGGNKSQAWF